MCVVCFLMCDTVAMACDRSVYVYLVVVVSHESVCSVVRGDRRCVYRRPAYFCSGFIHMRISSIPSLFPNQAPLALRLMIDAPMVTVQANVCVDMILCPMM